MQQNKLIQIFVTANIFSAIIVVYLLLSTLLLTKDPPIFPDEVWFSNNAYSLYKPQLFNDSPFASQFSYIDKITGRIIYGPFYFMILGFFLKVFGFSVESARLSSVFIGLLTIFAFYFLMKLIFKKPIICFIATFLLAIDYNFLRMVRFARPEIVVALFTLLAIYFYYKTLENQSIKNYFLTGVFLTLGFFTHYLIGAIGIVAVAAHFLLIKKRFIFNKKILILFLPLFVLSLVIFLGFSGETVGIKNGLNFFQRRAIPSLYSLFSIARGDFYIKILFSLYLIIFFYQFFDFFREKTKEKLLLLLLSSSNIFFVFYGSIGWYLGLLPLTAYLGLAAIKKKFFIIITVLILAISIVEQIKLINYYGNYSYVNTCREISNYLQKDSNVFLKQTIPDPYFCLAKERKDLKLNYEPFHDNSEKSLNLSLSRADYIIDYALNKKFIDSLKDKTSRVFFVQETIHTPKFAILELKK